MGGEQAERFFVGVLHGGFVSMHAMLPGELHLGEILRLSGTERHVPVRISGVAGKGLPDAELPGAPQCGVVGVREEDRPRVIGGRGEGGRWGEVGRGGGGGRWGGAGGEVERGDGEGRWGGGR